MAAQVASLQYKYKQTKMDKLVNSKVNSGEVGECAPLSATIPTPGSPLWNKAYHAFNNAKQRCTNPNNGSFAGYGGNGIQFLYDSFNQFQDDPGFPKNKSVTLDRIDPNGHYEPGNLRWVSKAAQAKNKVASSSGAMPSLDELVAKHKKVALAPNLRADVLDCWSRILAAIRRGYLTEADIELARSAGLSPEVFHGGWELGQVRDFAEPPSFFHLPSLTRPGKIIRMCGGPFNSSENADAEFGVLRGLGTPELSAFVPAEVQQWAEEDTAAGAEVGGAWIGQVTSDQLMAGGVEGWMLVAASQMRASRRDAMFCPALEAVRALSELRGPWNWGHESSRLLRVKRLFVPDVVLDVGEGLNLKPIEFGLIASLLEYRRKCGLRTVIGLQNPHKVPERLAHEVFAHFRLHQLAALVPSIDPVHHKFFSTGPQSPLKPGRYGFAHARAAL